jgi:signal transduction histidine kinase
VQEFVNAHHGSVEIVDGEFPGAHLRVRLPLNPRGNAAGDDTAAGARAAG